MKKALVLRKIEGFTLIETIVVVAVIGITLPVLIVIILSLMRMQLKINRLSQVKREGDYVISLLQSSIKDRAVSIHSGLPVNDSTEICKDAPSFSDSDSSLYFLDKSNKWFGYIIGSNSIASDSSSFISPINLTSEKILIEDFSFTCSKNEAYSPPFVTLSFNICYDVDGLGSCNSTRPEEDASLHYQSRIKLRNY
jgi:prepilin-type N-terminal cleavage/methylation domain-containing protein